LKPESRVEKDFQTRAVFLTGMTDIGNELLRFYPEVKIGESINRDICLKSMPMACKDGDMLVTNIGNLQAVCVTRLIPCFEKNSFKDKTYASLGLLIPKDTNPIPYYKMIQKILKKFESKGNLTKDMLVKIVPALYDVINKKFQPECS
jgi:hypothetical protein